MSHSFGFFLHELKIKGFKIIFPHFTNGLKLIEYINIKDSPVQCLCVLRNLKNTELCQIFLIFQEASNICNMQYKEITSTGTLRIGTKSPLKYFQIVCISGRHAM